MESLSIVIVNYKTWDNLTLCLESILNQNKINLEVIVVDNNSNDNEISIFKKKYKWVHWVENSKNYGFAKACNIGASLIKSKWSLFLNPDTILESNSISSLIKYCNINTDHRIIGIKQFNQKQNHTNSFGIFLNFWTLSGLFRSLIRINRGSYKSMNLKKIANPDWISGSFLLLRKKDFDLLNGWDENYWMYYEDMDLCKRAEKFKLKVSLLNNWSCTHFHGKASRKNNELKIITKSEVIISSHIYLEKHSKKSIKYLNHLLLIFFQFIELVIIGIFSKSKRKILEKSMNYWIRGLSQNVWESDRAKI
ncbi:MAG: hypothetical protein CMC38_05230 [Flavobacteriaceae bacterium]|nr:hypothetical protein [Flavobacteriaceae bacterium]|tara:strand:- start:805 stop:1728 length:924 start_codon:yes stop_codon:yes gene_type:complete